MDFNIQPYYDDFDQRNNYHKILFRPGYPVQTRELNQLQTIIQNQITQFGDHFFMDGDKVYGGELQIQKVYYLKMNTADTYGNEVYFDSSIIGMIAVGNSTGVKATVIAYENANEKTDSPDYPVLYVTFDSNVLSVSSSSTSSTVVTNIFDVNEKISFINSTDSQPTINSLTVGFYGLGTNNTSIGNALIARIESGIFFIMGHFVYVEQQNLVLERFDVYPSCRIGLNCSEFILTPEESDDLLDNSIANGSGGNYAAPGAHRYGILSTLSKTDFNTDDVPANFYELTQVINGSIYKKVETNARGEINEAYLARRTYDTSGDYVVSPFTADVREHRNNYRGVFKTAVPYERGDIVEVVYGTGENEKRTFFVNTKSGTPTSSPTWYTLNNGEFEKWSNITSEDSGNGGTTWSRNDNPNFNDGFYDASGKVTDIIITNPGSGYTNSPTVTIESGSIPVSEQATAFSIKDTSNRTRDADGKIVTSIAEIVVTNSGSGYFEEPTVTIGAPSKSTDTQATAKAVCDAGKSDKLLLNISTGKAYVKGYEIEKTDVTHLNIDKPTETISTNLTIGNPSTQYFRLSKDSIRGLPNFSRLEEVEAFDALGQTLGTCKSIAIVKSGDYHNFYFSDYVSTNSVNAGYSNINGLRTKGANSKIIGYIDVEHYAKNEIGIISSFTLTPVDGVSNMYSGTINVTNVIYSNFDVNDILCIKSINDADGSETSMLVHIIDIENEDSDIIEISVNTFIDAANSTKIASLTADLTNNTVKCYTTSVIVGAISENSTFTDDKITITSIYNKYNATSQSALVNNSFKGRSIAVLVHTGSTTDVYRGIVVDQTNTVSGTNLSTSLVVRFATTTGIVKNTLKNGIIVLVDTSPEDFGVSPTCIFDMDSSTVKSVNGQISWTSCIYAVGATKDNTNTAIIEIDPNVTWNQDIANDVFIAENKSGTVTLSLTSGSYSWQSGSHSIVINNGVPIGSTVYACIRVTHQGVRRTKTPSIERETGLTLDSNRQIHLKHPDCYEIRTVVGSDGIDYTASFMMNPNSNNFCYNLSYLEVSNGFNTPAATSYTVEYRYYARSNAGSNPCTFFDANSYVSFVNRDIPMYEGKLLSSYIDLRPDVYPNSTSDYNIPSGGYSITVGGVELGLARKDRIVLTSAGEFLDIKGIPSEDPSLPDIPSDSMNVFDITVYPESSSDYYIQPIVISAIDNKRYTMRDIGRLSKKVDILQEYTSLSLLETQTSNYDVGNRIKQGFVVDNFSNTTSNVRDEGKCHCSYDTNRAILRPPYVVNNIQLTEYLPKSTTVGSETVGRTARNYKVWDSKITLPVKNENVYLSFKEATTAISINPYNYSGNYVGSVSINPSSDDMFDNLTAILSTLADEYNDLDSRIVDVTRLANNNTEEIMNLKREFGSWNTYWLGRMAGVDETLDSIDAAIEELRNRKYTITNISNTYSSYNYNTYNSYTTNNYNYQYRYLYEYQYKYAYDNSR